MIVRDNEINKSLKIFAILWFSNIIPPTLVSCFNFKFTSRKVFLRG